MKKTLNSIIAATLLATSSIANASSYTPIDIGGPALSGSSWYVPWIQEQLYFGLTLIDRDRDGVADMTLKFRRCGKDGMFVLWAIYDQKTNIMYEDTDFDRVWTQRKADGQDNIYENLPLCEGQ